MSSFLCKDFIETQEGLIFAVVDSDEEERRILSSLRYRRTAAGCHKLSTRDANELLHEYWPQYLYYSQQRDVQLHGVPRDQIVSHHRPRQRLQAIWHHRSADPIEQKLCLLLEFFQRQGLTLRDIGVTGSLLIGSQNSRSDIDLVFYRRETFSKARELIRQLTGEGVLHPMTEVLWRDAYERRGCSLSYAEFLWHEQRKFNKAAVLHTKFDISLLVDELKTHTRQYSKQGKRYLEAGITDDSRSFDYPARYRLDHPAVPEIVSYTATYAGQAFKGETVAVLGQLEISQQGHQRIVVGTDREASGEYLKVLPSNVAEAN